VQPLRDQRVFALNEVCAVTPACIWRDGCATPGLCQGAGCCQGVASNRPPHEREAPPTAEQQGPDAWLVEWNAGTHEKLCANEHEAERESLILVEDGWEDVEVIPLFRAAAVETNGCTRSHPHEDMSEPCILRTEIARLQKRLAQHPETTRDPANAVNNWTCEHCGCVNETALVFNRCRRCTQFRASSVKANGDV
jgi:hypothetical protein